MREFGKVFCQIWESEDFRALSEDGRTLVLYLLTCKHATIAGVFRLPDGYACEDLQWTAERVRQGFANVSTKGFATRCEATQWVWLAKFLEWNQPENPNQWKAVKKVAGKVPEKCVWRAHFLYEIGHQIGINAPAPDPSIPSPFLNCSQTVAEPFFNQEQEKEQEKEQKQEVAPQPPAAPRPRRPAADAKEPAPSTATWNSYADAYELRYQTEPVRNARVNGQIAQLVARLGAQEAPHVAAFFVGHNAQFYVRDMHPVGLLLRDAEKLRTEWATNRQMTSTKAAQADKTATNYGAFQGLIAEAEARERNHAQQ